MKNYTRTSKSQRGAALVEFALVFPILIILIMGIIEFSLLLYDKAVITNASREAARFGIVFRTDRPTATQSEEEHTATAELRTGEIEDIVTAYAGTNLVTFGNDTEIDFDLPNGPCESSGQELVVIVGYRYDFLLLPNLLSTLFGGAIPGGLDLNARTVMRCE